MSEKPTRDGFTAEERAAMKERAAELRTESTRAATAGKTGETGKKRKAAADEADVPAKIAKRPGADREMAERVHVIVTTLAPDLAPKLYYGMPG